MYNRTPNCFKKKEITPSQSFVFNIINPWNPALWATFCKGENNTSLGIFFGDSDKRGTLHMLMTTQVPELGWFRRWVLLILGYDEDNLYSAVTVHGALQRCLFKTCKPLPQGIYNLNTASMITMTLAPMCRDTWASTKSKHILFAISLSLFSPSLHGEGGLLLVPHLAQ